MEMVFINLVIIILYVRTYKYNQLIDDFVPRSGVLLVLGERPSHHSFYDTQRPLLATITNVGVFMAACTCIYVIWGFWPALLFAVLPTNVCGVAWTTGNYYMSTVLLTLAAHWFVMNLGLFGLGAGVAFYVAALGSTVNVIPYAFVLPLLKHDYLSLIMFIPLAFFLFGKRFQTGLKLRKDKHKLIKVETGTFSWKSIFVMVKVVGYYIALNIWPSRLGVFHEYPKYANSQKTDLLFWLNLILLGTFAYFGYQYNLEGVIWWFLFIGIFSQFTTFGMFVAERYMVLANIGFCLIIASYLRQVDHSNVILSILATLWFCKSWSYTRAYKSNLSLFCHSISAFPGTPENYNNLASHYLERNQREKAIEPLLVSLRLSTVASPGTHINLANCYAQIGYYQKALFHTQEALKYCAENHREGLEAQVKELKDKILKIERNRDSLKRHGII